MESNDFCDLLLMLLDDDLFWVGDDAYKLLTSRFEGESESAST